MVNPKTPMEKLLAEIQGQIPNVTQLINVHYWLNLEKEQMCEMWVEGNNQGWFMETDDPQAAEDYFNEKYHP